ncbi:hypothetical protein LDENG_00098830 [Lucifuga dentata]|nr:hypothetical protein LDENG_00098830 [Lucifuga dentata]
MSISRKNWSALSSLTRQWTMEDEEEVERERRRRFKSSSSAVDPDDDLSQAPRDTSTSGSTRGTDSTSETSQGLKSAEQLQLDFVETLRVRDEKRRMRQVETLRQQKEEEDEEDEADEAEVGRGRRARVELLGDLDEKKINGSPSVDTSFKPQHPLKTAPVSPNTTTSTFTTNRQLENGESQDKDPEPKPPSTSTRKFVSSVSISLDKSPSSSGRTTPMSCCSPTTPQSPLECWPSPCQSPPPQGAQSPIQKRHTEETSVSVSSSNGSANFEQTTRPAFIRQSSRTLSFRMLKKKEEESMPLQRSASVRMASKKFESNTLDQNQDEVKASPFQRNSRQRLSSRTIQEKMERLAQAAQKSETMRSPDVTQRTLFLLDEVSRKRGLFEKEQQAASTNPGVSRQEFRGFASGVSDRINRWINKTNQTGPSHNVTDLRHVDISSKRSLSENRGEDSIPKATSQKIYK